MRYLVASDLHYNLRQLDWIADQAGEFDAVVLGGDHVDLAGRVDLDAQISLLSAYFSRLAGITTVIANSGNHDLSGRLANGEKAALWLDHLDPRVVTDGASVAVGADLVSVCAWWEGPHTRGNVEDQLEADAARRRDVGGVWAWAYHSPPDRSPTSWSGRRHFGDDVLNELIERFRPDLVFAGHVHESPFRPDGSWFDVLDGTLVLNAGRQPGPAPAHLVVDTAAREATWYSYEGDVTVELPANPTAGLS